jgi:hypothetical protein
MTMFFSVITINKLATNMKCNDLVPNLGYILPQYVSGNLKHLCKRKQGASEYYQKISVPS